MVATFKPGLDPWQHGSLVPVMVVLLHDDVLGRGDSGGMLLVAASLGRSLHYEGSSIHV
jgi:hypothetical protein